MTGLVSLSSSAACKQCDWTATGPTADTEARRHSGELTGGPKPPHVTVSTSVPSLTTAAGGDL